MDIGDLLQLEGALEGERIVDPASHVEEVIAIQEAFRDSSDRIILPEHNREEVRQLQEPFDHLAGERWIDEAPRQAELEREECHRCELGRERFRRGDADLDACSRIDNPVGLTGQRAAEHIADRDRSRALVPGLAQSGQGVGSLPGLGDWNREHAAVEDRSTVTEL